MLCEFFHHDRSYVGGSQLGLQQAPVDLAEGVSPEAKRQTAVAYFNDC